MEKFGVHIITDIGIRYISSIKMVILDIPISVKAAIKKTEAAIQSLLAEN